MAASIASESSPSPRGWQNWRPPLTPHVFGFLLTDEVAQKYCAHYCPLSDEDDDLASHLAYLQVEGLQPILGDKYDLQNFTSVLVYKDRKRMAMGFALVLADNRGIDDDQRVPPPPEVVVQIADELGLEGAEREPRWYKPV